MTTERISSTYENGKRIEMQKATYDKSDDLFTLANLQRRYERLCETISNQPEGSALESLEKEKAELEAKIAEQEALIDGYTVEN